MDLKLSAAALAAVAYAAGSASAALVAQYTFESETAPFADVAPGGTANDGTASASTPQVARSTAQSAEGNASANFTSITSGTVIQYITLGNESDFDFTDDFTLALWVRPSTVTGNRTLITKGNNYRLRHNGDDLELFLNNLEVASVDNIVVNNEWQHFALVFDKTGLDASVQFYVDGVASGPATTILNVTNPTNNVNARLGSTNTTANGSEGYLGYMDDVRFYDEALSAGAVSALVPEPASLSVLALAGGLVLRRRRSE